MEEGTKRAIKDYSFLLAYLVPCAVVVAFVNVLLIPKFELIARELGADTPGPLSAMVRGFRIVFFNFWIVIPLLLIPIALAEIFSRFWRSRRSIFFGVFTWLVVFTVIVALVALGTSALALIPFATKP